jgi:hypothetical protein
MIVRYGTAQAMSTGSRLFHKPLICIVTFCLSVSNAVASQNFIVPASKVLSSCMEIMNPDAEFNISLGRGVKRIYETSEDYQSAFAEINLKLMAEPFLQHGWNRLKIVDPYLDSTLRGKVVLTAIADPKEMSVTLVYAKMTGIISLALKGPFDDESQRASRTWTGLVENQDGGEEIVSFSGGEILLFK